MSAATEISATEAFQLWAADYDIAPNALLALETRLLAERIQLHDGMRILDAGCGTGRWMNWAASRGACVFGIDACHEMLVQAQNKRELRGRAALADMGAIPLEDNAVDTTLCSFTMAYVLGPARAFQELARVSSHVIVSDLHPNASRAGWTRSFRSGHRLINVPHVNHSATELDGFASAAGLVQAWRIEAPFGEAERPIFASAGKEAAFEKARGIPAVLITLWRKSSV